MMSFSLTKTGLSIGSRMVLSLSEPARGVSAWRLIPELRGEEGEMTHP